jgi:nicotinamidase-related amidase
MRDWMRMIPESELKTYKNAGYLTDMKLGLKPALIIVDVTYAFTGYEGQTLQEAIASFGSACGPVSWQAIPKIAKLISIFRQKELPVIFTNAATSNTAFTGRATKSKRTKVPPPRFNEFPDLIAPRDCEWVLGKNRASAFFQTPLCSYLIQNRVDTLIFCGVSTSGCVRASVVDGFSHGFATFVVDDCCFDRSEYAHAANLFDMEAKYASVLSLEDISKLMLDASTFLNPNE